MAAWFEARGLVGGQGVGMLGDSEFVQSFLKQNEKAHERRYRLKAKGLNLDFIAPRVSELLYIPMDDLSARGKHRHRVTARRFKASATAISTSVLRGKTFANTHGLEREPL